MVEEKPIPNQKLRYERERRAWSQLDVADRVGTTSLNVGRWERGVTQPGPYFRQKLCEIFEKTPQELGLIHETVVAELQVVVPASPTSAVLPQEILPLPWNIPYNRNLLFTGREEIISKIRLALISDEHPLALTQPQAISGLGGIGKTQTAVEYTYRYRDDYAAVFWARADSTELLSSDYGVIAALLALPQRNEQDQSLVVKGVLHWFDTHERWLLILDNADDLEMVRAFIPSAGKGHILLTTRAHSTGAIAGRIELDTMTAEEGLLLLLRRSKRIKDRSSSVQTIPETMRSQAQAIVEAVDGLPLALDQAGAYIENTGCTLVDYLKFYKTRRHRLLRMRGESAEGHPEPVATTWSLSFDRIARANQGAAALLRLCAFLHPDEIPESMIVEGASALDPLLQTIAEDEMELNEAIGELRKYSLVKRDSEKKVLNIHRLVQAVIRDSMGEDMQREWAEKAVKMVSNVFPDPEQSEDWSRLRAYLPQVYYCIELIEQHKIRTSEAARLLLRAGLFLLELAPLTDEGERLTQQALAISEHVFGPDDPEVAHCLDQLGWITAVPGRRTQAEALYLRAIAIYEKAFGSEHPDLAECRNNLALLYLGQGKYGDAENLLRETLALRERTFGLDHQKIAESLVNLAVTCFHQTRLEEAEQLLKQAYTIHASSRTHNLYEANTLRWLGLVYQEQGKYEQAEVCTQQSLAIFQQVFGNDHIEVLAAMRFLGILHQEQEKYEQAELLLRQVVALYEQGYGARRIEKEKDIFVDIFEGECLEQLGVLYYRQGRYEQAEPLLQQALALLQPHLDDSLRKQEQDHTLLSDATECFTTLALLHLNQGNIEAAEVYHRKALVLTQQHWNSGCLFNLKREREIQEFERRFQKIRAKHER